MLLEVAKIACQIEIKEIRKAGITDDDFHEIVEFAIGKQSLRNELVEFYSELTNNQINRLVDVLNKRIIQVQADLMQENPNLFYDSEDELESSYEWIEDTDDDSGSCSEESEDEYDSETEGEDDSSNSYECETETDDDTTCDGTTSDDSGDDNDSDNDNDSDSDSD